MLTECYRSVIISNPLNLATVMTFSEYVKTFAYQQYLEYCRQKGIVPELDLDVKPQKLCALVKPK